MADHIRTKIRKAFKQRLSAAVGDLHVHYASRIIRNFQPDNYPLALIAVSDTPMPNDEPPGSRIVDRNVNISIKISERMAFEDVEDRIDNFCGEIEKVFAAPGDLGFGKYWNWKVGQTSNPAIEEFDEGQVLMSVVLTITFTVSTLDTDPTNNIHS